MTTTDLRSAHWHEVRAKVVGNRLEVYSRLLASGPRTCTELATLMGWDKCSVRPRVTELCELSHAMATGTRRNGEHEFVALTARDAEAMHAVHARQIAPAITLAITPVAATDNTLEFSFT